MRIRQNSQWNQMLRKIRVSNQKWFPSTWYTVACSDWQLTAVTFVCSAHVRATPALLLNLVRGVVKGRTTTAQHKHVSKQKTTPWGGRPATAAEMDCKSASVWQDVWRCVPSKKNDVTLNHPNLYMHAHNESHFLLCSPAARGLSSFRCHEWPNVQQRQQLQQQLLHLIQWTVAHLTKLTTVIMLLWCHDFNKCFPGLFFSLRRHTNTLFILLKQRQIWRESF